MRNGISRPDASSILVLPSLRSFDRPRCATNSRCAFAAFRDLGSRRASPARQPRFGRLYRHDQRAKEVSLALAVYRPLASCAAPSRRVERRCADRRRIRPRRSSARTPSRMRVTTCATFSIVTCDRRGSASNWASVLGRAGVDRLPRRFGILAMQLLRKGRDGQVSALSR